MASASPRLSRSASSSRSSARSPRARSAASAWGSTSRARRVGEKGKHRGSHGLYPASAVRRIHLIKSLMDEGSTLEEIRRSFIFFRGQLDGVERSLDELFAALDKSLADKAELKPPRRKELERLLGERRKQADQ